MIKFVKIKCLENVILALKKTEIIKHACVKWLKGFLFKVPSVSSCSKRTGVEFYA